MGEGSGSVWSIVGGVGLEGEAWFYSIRIAALAMGGVFMIDIAPKASRPVVRGGD